MITRALLVFAFFPGLCLGGDWLQFRGNSSTSTAEGEKLPTKWSKTENIAWSVDLPGRGLSSPIIVGGKVFVTASSGYRQDRLHLLCYDLKSGQMLWERQFWATGRTLCHPKMANATPTPASDGERVYAFFSSNDVVCVDLDGNLEWFRGLTVDYPNASNSLGMSSSPVIVGETLVVQVENDSESFSAGLDLKSGLEKWKLDRPKSSNWTSPTVLRGKNPADDVVLIQSQFGLTAFAPSTGKAVWSFDEECSPIPSTGVGQGVIFVPSAGLTALDVSTGSANPKVLWKEQKLGPGTGSPIVYMDKVFVLNRGGVLNCADSKSGKILWSVRAKGSFSATPVAANGHIYCVNEDGMTTVVKGDGEKGEIVSENELGEIILCTPAIADNALFVRSDGHLWKIAE